MAKINLKMSLQKLFNNELSSLTNDKKKILSAYKTLMDILKQPELNKQLHGHHELIFECISQIFLTSFNKFFDDDQLRSLLELASNARVLSMSQNQIIDGWLQNIEERTFEKPDQDENEDDDDDLYEDATESEEEEEEKKILTVRDTNKKLNQRRSNQHQQNNASCNDSNSASVKVKSPPSIETISSQRNGHVAHSRNHRDDYQNSKRNNVNKPPNRAKNNRGARSNNSINTPNKGSNTNRAKGGREPPFDNKYGVDLSLYDCYICGEYGHVQYDCPKKQGNQKASPHANARRGSSNKKSRNRSKSSSSNSSKEAIQTEINQTKFQEIYNQSSKLLNSSLTIDERNKTFNLFLSLIQNLHKQHGKNLPKIFLEKESLFYSLFCHIALNDYLFTNDQYSKLYQLKNLLLSKKENLLNEDRSIFSRQRILIPLNIITDHIKHVTQIQQTIFNDFQEYIIRSTSPISIILYDLIKYLLQSNIHIDTKSFEYFTKKILFDLKKDIFTNEQLNELQTYVTIRNKRLERNQQKQIWKERLNLFKNNQISSIDLNQWLSEFEEILKTNDIESKDSSTIVINHPMWYFAILLMASSGHLNEEQYQYLLNLAIQSILFNPIQKFYFQFYLKQNQAPITMKELNDIKIQLESYDKSQKELAYQTIQSILDRPKPIFNINDLNQTTDQSNNLDDIIPIIDNHILSNLISLVEIICSDLNTFSIEQCQELLNKFLQQSTIVRPIPSADQQRLISLNEFKSVIDKKDFQSTNKTHERSCSLINPNILNQLLTNILLHDYQAHLKFFNLLEEIISLMNFNEITIEFEINRCLLSTIILIISENDFSNSKNIDFYRQRLKYLIEKEKQFFTLLLTEQQYQLIQSRLITKLNIDSIIDLIKINSNEKNFQNLILFIKNALKNKNDLEKLFNFILYTFDNEKCLTIKQTIEIINLILQQQYKTYQNLLQFLLDLLQLNIHSSPKIFLQLFELNQDNQQTLEQIILILKIQTGKYAIVDWKKTMMKILKIIFLRNDDHQQLKTIAQQSPMLQMKTFQQQLQLDWKNKLDEQSEDNKQSSTISKATDTIDHSVAHREIFHHLESDDASMNALVVQQLRAYLIDEQLSSEILLSKFIQALQFIFKNKNRFVEVSLDEWTILISKNRGKIFSNDAECDQLLMNILFARINKPNDTLNSLQRLIQSKKAHERFDGIQILLLLLENTQLNNKNISTIYLPTISDKIYPIITRVLFDEKFRNNQVRQCLTMGKNSWLLNDEHRQKLNI